MAEIDWTKFCTRISINSGVQSIYQAWTKQAGLERWFLRKAEFTTTDNTLRGRESNIQKGDSYRWLWYGYADDTVEHGKILEANGKDFLQFTFSGGSVVSVKVKIEEGETIVELWQENIPLDDSSRMNYYVGCTKGWTFYLANLKSELEGGLDLRNKNVLLKSVINA